MHLTCPHCRNPIELVELPPSGDVVCSSSVYKARDPQLDRIVALEVPRSGNLGSASERERFLREARAAAQLDHPGIVSVHEVGEHDGRDYIVSDLVDGVNLADWLTGRRPTEDGRDAGHDPAEEGPELSGRIQPRRFPARRRR